MFVCLLKTKLIIKIVYFIFSFGLTPARPLQVLNPLLPTASYETSLSLATTGLIQRMEPITNLQV